jgi:2'-5' RNA ligase
MIRLFLAVNAQVAVTRRIAEEVAKLKPAVRESMRVAWVPPANLHVTLMFLGSAHEEILEGIEGRLAKVAARHAPFQMKARGLGAFPSAEKPRVLWFGVDGGEALLKLQKDVEGAMVELGFAKDQHAYHPHITVGRVKDQSQATAESTWPASPEIEAGVSTVSEIVVYESKTTSAGAEYTARARVQLSKKENA